MKLLNKKEGEIYKILNEYLELKKLDTEQYKYHNILNRLIKYFPNFHTIQYYNPNVYKN